MSSASADSAPLKRSRTDEHTVHAQSFVGAFAIAFVHATIGYEMQESSTAERTIMSSLYRGSFLGCKEIYTIVALEAMGSPRPVPAFEPLRIADELKIIFAWERALSAELQTPVDISFQSKTLGIRDEPKSDAIQICLSTSRYCAYIPTDWSVLSMRPIHMLHQLMKTMQTSVHSMESLFPLAFQTLQLQPVEDIVKPQIHTIRIRIPSPDHVAHAYCTCIMLMKKPGTSPYHGIWKKLCNEMTRIASLDHTIHVTSADEKHKTEVALRMIIDASRDRTTVFAPVRDARFDGCIAHGHVDTDGREWSMVAPLVLGIRKNALQSNISSQFKLFAIQTLDRYVGAAPAPGFDGVPFIAHVQS